LELLINFFLSNFRIGSGVILRIHKAELASVANTDQFDPDPYQIFHTDPDRTICYASGSGSLQFQRSNVPKTVLFIHLNLIFLSQ
jgi:hypothetical protein